MTSVFLQRPGPSSLARSGNRPANQPAKGPRHAGKQPSGDDSSLHRSGAVARMLGMPVATLRVWERRYALCQPQLTSSGQRLYSANDVRRLALLKQLTERGHAIGTLAALNFAQLQAVAQTHLHTVAQRQGIDGAADLANAADAEDAAHGVKDASPAAWRVAAVGAGWSSRLRQAKLLQALGRPWEMLGPFPSLASAAKALKGQPVDALLVHEAGLHDDWLAQVHKHAAWRALPLAVLYGYAAEPVCERLAAAGVALLQEPQSNPVLAQWLRGWSQAAQSPAAKQRPDKPRAQALPGPRWDDAVLSAFANLPSTVACECPRQVARLLIQLQHFESYSASCASRTVADAELHAYLHQVASAARLRFEAALERVALHEGLLLPQAARAGVAR
jgi:MerR family transcriptional regulator, light-induced transcriptional regulator